MSTTARRAASSPRGATRGGSKPRRKKAVTVNDSPASSDSEPDEAEVLFQMDESFAFSHGGETATGDVTVDTLDSLAAVPSMKGHSDAVRSMAFDPESNTLFTASWDETVLAWNLMTGLQHGVLPHGCWVNAVMLVPRAGIEQPLQILTAAEDGNLTRWQCYDSATGPEYLVSGQWKLDHGALVAMSIQADLVFVASISRVVGFSLSSGSVTRQYRVESDVNALVALDEVLYCGCEDGKISCVDIVGGFTLRQLPGHRGAVRCLVAAETSNTLYSAGDDGAVKIWMLSTGMCQKSWLLHRKPITSISLHMGARDRFLYSGSLDGTVRCTRLASGMSHVCRSCTCTALIACDLVDKHLAMAASAKKVLSPAQIAAASLGWMNTQGAANRRKSLTEIMEASNASSSARIVCADHVGHVYNYPCSASEAGVVNADLAKHRGAITTNSRR